VTVRGLAGVLLLVAMTTDVVEAVTRIASYRELPYGACRFVDEQFHVEPDRFQEEALIAFANPDPAYSRISLQAAAGVGKSAVMSWCAWYFLATQCRQEHEHPKGLVTGVTDANLRDNFWAEMAKWQGVSPWLTSAFTWNTDRIAANDHPHTWFLGRRAFSKTASADAQGATLSGIHARAVALFIDESGTIPPTVLRAAEQALADRPEFGKIMQAGNPSDLQGMLHVAATTARHQWIVIIVTNDPDDPRRASRGDVEWARSQIAMYGRENPWVKAFILGQFPPSSINALLGIEDVQAAMTRTLEPHQYDWQQKRIGVDVARFGDDRTVLAPRQGLAWFRPVVMRGARTTEIAARVFAGKQTFGSELELVDDTGHWGHGVIDNLVTAGVPAIGIVFHAPALNPRYKNRRAEMWIQMAQSVKGGAALPNIPELVAELVTPTYTFLNGTFVLEEKDRIKERLGRSPDIADAYALTYALPDLPNDVMAKLRLTAKVESEWDPFRPAGGHP
jgi:phage terminase large subunit